VPDWAALGIEATPATTTVVVLRLVAALVLGGVVALIYRLSRGRAEVTDSFTVTLVLLSILIAMVTQVIGDNVARAFSLVGALSIVRFRTVVRDTQDTAYVIFAVAVGMAMGAGNAIVGIGGIGIVGLAAFVMRGRNRSIGPLAPDELPFELTVRLGLGGDAEALLGSTLDGLGVTRRLMTVGTARQGLAVEVGYRAALKNEAAAGDVVNALNRVEGVQGVSLRRVMPTEP
jgi:uncharacterized membrane protein YhiD involved in acid resistance